MSKKTKDGVTKALNIGSGFVSAMSAVLAAVLILYSGYVLYDSMAVEVSAFSAYSDLLKYKPKQLAENEEPGPSLSEINPDYRAWITINGSPASPIDYPIVQGPNDTYYAARDVYNEPSLTGAIYLAAGNKGDFSDSYNILYGHHMDNGAMFGSLDNFKDEAYFNSHRYATLTTDDGTMYDIIFFGVVSTDAYESRIYEAGNRAADVISFLEGSRDDDTGIGTTLIQFSEYVASSARKVIALSTCASADTNGRLVVFGKMIPREPEPEPEPSPSKKPGGGTTSTTPTPEPEEEEEQPPVKLTVKYYDEYGRPVFPDEEFIHTPGDNYYVVSPQKPGYDVDIEIVRGTIEEDMIVKVRYIPKTWTLTIRYILLDGSVAAKTYSTPIKTGEGYDVASPAVPGYKPVYLRKAGVNPGWDEEHTVIYVPENQELEDLPTPLSLGWTVMQIGICFE